jgi:peptide/nickel transport system substrate-binding protein
MGAFNFLEAKPPSYIGVHLNTQQPYLSDKRVRQALMHAIDRETLNETLYAGASDIIDSPISVPQFGDSPNLKRYEYDPEKAKQLLTEAGWDPERKLRWGVDAAPADETFFATINGYWSKVGVEAEYQVTGEDLSVYQAPSWDFDLVQNALAIGHPSQIAYYYDARKCTYACFRYTDPRYEELFDQSLLQHPEEEARAIIWELQEIIAEQVPALWLVRAPDIWGMGTRVHGLRPLYMAHILADWEMEKVWVD